MRWHSAKFGGHGLAGREIQEQFHGVSIASRWVLVGTETIQSAYLLALNRVSHAGVAVLLALFGYNVASIWIAYRIPWRRLPLAVLLAIDLLFVAVAAYFTGVSRSPFLGQLYLIIFAGSLFFGIRGGILIGSVAAALTLFFALKAPIGLSQDARDLIPYFLVAGAFSGYLSDRLREAFHRYRESAEREAALAVEREASRREMELARAIQEAAMSPAVSMSVVPGLDVAMHRAFSRAVGGDLAMVMADSSESCRAERHVGLIVGDVSGKGISAALTATSVVYLLPHLRPLSDCGSALATLNLDLVNRLPAAVFVTLVFAEISLAGTAASVGRVRIWSAGHPPALIWRHTNGAAEIANTDADCGGSVLGVFDSWEVPVPPEYELSEGDVVVLYSDGLLETRNGAGEEFGVDRIVQVVEDCAGQDATRIVNALADAVTAWGECQDDLTILACRRVPAAS